MIIFIPLGSSSSGSTPGVVMTGRDLVSQALIEIGVLSPIDTLGGDTADYALAKLNRLFDSWNAEKRAAFCAVFATYTLTPNLQPHTIGPTGTFNVVQRPETIEGANLIYASAPTVRLALNLRTADWWKKLTLQTYASTIPTDLYYEPAWPNGQINLWPISSAANQLELLSRVLISAMTLDDELSAPPGYRDAIIYTLAESLVVPLRVPGGMPAGLPQLAKNARDLIFGNNDQIPDLDTRDAGMPGGGGVTGSYLTGWM